MNKKILLTGATGFIGHYLAHHLVKSGHQLRLLVRSTSQLDHLSSIKDQLEFITGDMLDFPSLEDAVAGCDTIIHAAAMVSFQRKEQQLMMDINGRGTKMLIDVALHHGVNRFIHMSSVSALDRNVKGVISEENRWQETRPHSAYAQSKFVAEREIWRGQGEGLSVAALYPSIVIGAGRWTSDSTPSLYDKVAKGLKYYPTGSSGYVDVRDVAKATEMVLGRDVNGDRFLLNAENMSWQRAFAQIANSLEMPPPSFSIPPWLSGLAWPVFGLLGTITGKTPTITRDTHRTAQSKLVYDGSKITRETGFKYRPIETTFQETGEAYRAVNGKTAWLAVS
ncbi:MAG: NAD-dependent epimerase/dehydratase family protein [Bacteroidota bacterium]